jgi:hypothetical protein
LVIDVTNSRAAIISSSQIDAGRPKNITRVQKI